MVTPKWSGLEITGIKRFLDECKRDNFPGWKLPKESLECAEMHLSMVVRGSNGVIDENGLNGRHGTKRRRKRNNPGQLHYSELWHDT